MPVSCSAYGCTNRQKKNSGIHFHKFPFSRIEVLNLWIQAVRREEFQPTNASRICSVHFRDTDYIEDESKIAKRLKPDAVPSVFPEFFKHFPTNPKLRRKFNKRNVCGAVISSESNSILPCESNCIAVNEEVSNTVLCTDEKPISVISRFNDASTETDEKKFVRNSTQTDEISFSPTAKEELKENQSLKPCQKRQSQHNNMRDLLNTVHCNKLGRLTSKSVSR